MSFNPQDPTDLEQLQTEVRTDPQVLGYRPQETEAGVIEPINRVRQGVSYIIRKPNVSAELLRASTLLEPFRGLLEVERTWLRWLTAGGGQTEDNVPATDEIRLRLTGLGGGASDTIWAVPDQATMIPIMTAIFDVQGSRAEVIWGFGTVVSANDWYASGGAFK